MLFSDLSHGDAANEELDAVGTLRKSSRAYRTLPLCGFVAHRVALSLWFREPLVAAPAEALKSSTGCALGIEAAKGFGRWPRFCALFAAAPANRVRFPGYSRTCTLPRVSGVI